MRKIRRAMIGLVLAAAPAVAAGEPQAAHECLVLLKNGDQLRGQLEKIEGRALTLRPAIAPESALAVDLDRVARLTFSGRGDGGAPGKQECLKLRDGSQLHGRFIKLTDTSVHFDFEQSGPLELAREAVAELVKPGAPAVELPGLKVVTVARIPDGELRIFRLGGNPKDLEAKLKALFAGKPPSPTLHDDGGPPLAASPSPPQDRSACYTVVTTREDVLIGNLAQQPDGVLAISGAAVEAKLPYASVARIVFPRPSPAKAVEPLKGLISTVTTRAGSVAAGTDLLVAKGRLSVTLSYGQRVKLPIECVTQIAFSGSGNLASSHCILVWGRHSARGQRFTNTLGILKQHLGNNFQIVENFDDCSEPSFRQVLLRCRALVIPAMTKWDPARAREQAAQLKPAAEEFLRLGGNVVLLGITDSQTDFLKQAGLLDVRVKGVTGGKELRFAFTEEGGKLAAGLGDSFQPQGYTHLYAIGRGFEASSPVRIDLASAWAFSEIPSGSPIIVRRAGRGWIVLLGMDYSSFNEQTSKLLVNAISYR